MPLPSPELPRTSPAGRVLLVAGGSLALLLGVIGIFLPLLPTTPLVLLAAYCYARAWPRAHRWMQANRYLGPICAAGREGRYLPPRSKVAAIGFTLVSFSVTIVFAVDAWQLRALLALLCVLVTAWLARLPTQPRAVPVPSEVSDPGRP